MRLSYDFLEPIDEILECVPVPKEHKALQYRSKNDIKIRLSYDFLEPINEIPECVPVPKEQGGRKKL